MLILYLLLGVALIGTLTSSIFLGLSLAGAIKFHRDARRARDSISRVKDFPLVSVLKPVHGLEVRLREKLEGYFRQDYPAYEILFAADEENDPALEVVREVSARYPRIPCKILVNGIPPWPNPPAYSFSRLTELAEYEILVTSDSDVEVAPNYLREVVRSDPGERDPAMAQPSRLFVLALDRTG